MTENKSNTTAIVIGIVVLVACICLLVAGLIGYGFYSVSQSLETTRSPVSPNDGTPTTEPEVTRPPVDSISGETLASLNATVVPENDPYDLACRLLGICDVSTTVPGKPYKLNDKETFWITNSDTAEQNEITATLVYITAHSYFWVEEGTQADQGDVKALMDTFESKIYPTDREFFGSEMIPGVDGDEHIFVVYAESIGHNIAGYFSSLDSYNPLVREYSNAHETYVLGTSQNLADEYTYATLAHEFVHMIQFASDRNDVSWVNEGFAEVGAFLNGYDIGGADWIYVQQPDMQLNTWVGNDSPDFSAHYGQSFLYLTYFLDRFGEDATKALTNNPENDLTSVDDTLSALNLVDSRTGQVITADDLFMDWAAALYLNDGSVGDGRFTYQNYPNVPQTSATESVTSCPASAFTRDVNQYGVDYISIQCSGDYTIKFSGSTLTGLLPVEPHSGDFAFWSNRGDESNMTLTRKFDLTSVSAPIQLTYHTWYDLEEDYDYLYLEASADDGKTWQIIPTPSGTGEDPSGNSYGWGYNAQTNGWIEESVDLSEFADQQVQIRFEYVTDAAINGEGFLLDDVSVDAAGYKSGFEEDDGGWQAQGFVRVQNTLPQTFRLSLILKSDTTSVTSAPVTADQTAEMQISLGSGEEAVLIVTGTTRFTRQGTTYQIEIR